MGEGKKSDAYRFVYEALTWCVLNQEGPARKLEYNNEAGWDLIRLALELLKSDISCHLHSEKSADAAAG